MGHKHERGARKAAEQQAKQHAYWDSLRARAPPGCNVLTCATCGHVGVFAASVQEPQCVGRSNGIMITNRVHHGEIRM
jgi:hypothetical protein